MTDLRLFQTELTRKKDRIKRMISAELNQAQREMLLSERVFGNQALPVISVKLKLPEFGAAQVKDAAEKVFESGDIFTAVLMVENERTCFSPGTREILPCVIGESMEEREAEAYMERRDRVPLLFPEELYGGEVLPLKDGGAILYVRFHHILLDGYGMSLFAQRVLDVLSGKTVRKSVFFSQIDTGEKGDGEEKGETTEPEGMERRDDSGVQDEEFWRSYFMDAEFEPALYGEIEKNYAKISRHCTLEGVSLKEVEKFAAENGVTIPYVVGAAYGVYLALATGKRDAVFLMARLNRKSHELGTLGCYTLPVPVRVHVEQEDTFGDICRKLQESARLASRHKGCGFDTIIKILKEEGIISGSVSEYGFNFYSYHIQTELEYSLKYSVSGGINNHLRWNVFYKEGGLSHVFDLRKGIYDDEMAQYFEEAITEILSRGLDGMKISQIPCIGKREKEHLLGIKGNTIPIEREATIPGLFRKAAALFPKRPALYAGEYSFSFEELDSCSDAIAGHLMGAGVESGDIVAFMLKRDYRLIPVMLGIAKTGAAFLPIDPQYPKDRIQYILEDSEAKYLISSKNVDAAAGRDYLEADELFGNEIEGHRKTQHTSEEGDLQQGTESNFKLPYISREQPAYLIYTSGTTGRPKGVILSHKGIANIVHPDNNPFNRDLVKNGKGIVAIGSICFDISLYEIFVPMFNGLFVEFGNEKAMLDAGELAAHILRHGADVLHCTPSRVASYLENPEFIKALSQNVKAMLLAGEQLPESLVRELKGRYGIRVYNGYGPTETTIGATITEAGDCHTIGAPIANTGILLLNQDRKQVPMGVPGEICIFGSGVGLGYRNRPEETEEKFIFWEGMRVYRTGDLGHLDSEGRLIYHGRNDRQVKLRGLRIELSEIEKVMGSCPGVAQAACVLRKVDKRDHLAGFYSVVQGGRLSREELRTFMKKRLTAYMVPELLTELKEMPQTPGGKTDLKALGKIPVEYVREYTPPMNDMEKIVCNAFSSVLDMEQVGTQDNFFELGGDSLSAVELIAILEKELEGTGVELDYESLFRYPTPGLLAENINGNVEEHISYPIDGLEYGGIDEYLAGSVPGRLPQRQNGLGNVLITGATGYLGAHILIELLQNPTMCEKVYCLVRPKGRLTAQKRMRNTLFYYAESDFAESMGKKWEVIEGDITESGIFREEFTEKIDTIINSAANVAHYAQGDRLEQVNTKGVKNLIAYGLSQKALICQISTISVGGLSDSENGVKEFSEENFYIGQRIDNQYIYSKYMAEYELLRAAVDKGLGVKIMRVGNLQGRSRDGEFQMNLKSNAFTRKLFSYMKMGAVPKTVYDASVNFSPVDETAHMILALTKTDANYSVFHVYPPEEVAFGSLFRIMEQQGHKIEVVSEEEFGTRFQELKQTKEGRSLVEGLLTDNLGGTSRENPVVQKMTNQLLDQLGEAWLPMTEEYLAKYLSALEGLNM